LIYQEGAVTPAPSVMLHDSLGKFAMVRGYFRRYLCRKSPKPGIRSPPKGWALYSAQITSLREDRTRTKHLNSVFWYWLLPTSTALSLFPISYLETHTHLPLMYLILIT